MLWHKIYHQILARIAKPKQDQESTDQQWVHGEDIASTSGSSYGSWKSSEMHTCGSCFFLFCYSSKDLVMSFVSNVVAKAKKCIMLEQFKLQI